MAATVFIIILYPNLRIGVLMAARGVDLARQDRRVPWAVYALNVQLRRGDRTRLDYGGDIVRLGNRCRCLLAGSYSAQGSSTAVTVLLFTGLKNAPRKPTREHASQLVRNGRFLELYK